MKTKNCLTIQIVLIFVLLGKLSYSQNIDSVRITETFNKQPLTSFFDVLTQKYGIKVFYKESWVKPFTITKTFQNTPLIQALNNTFYNHDLTYKIFQNDAVFVFRRSSDVRSRFDEQTQMVIIGNPINVGRYKNAKVSGKVIDGKTGEPLSGAVLLDLKTQKGTSTNAGGTFEMELTAGDHDIRISFVGFESSVLKVRVIEDGFAEFELFEESLNIEEVTVRGGNADLPRAQMSMVQMTAKELKQLPSLLGETDVLKGLTMLAGVQSVGELSSGFNVRGGNTDQNLILINGSPVFNASHLFGFLSLINPDVVDDVRLFKGSMPAKFGERVASVMEVDFKDGNSENIKVYGGIGVINSRLTLDGPLSKNKKLTFIAGGRSSYTSWALKKIPDLNLSRSVTQFYDLSGKISYKFNQHNRLSLMVYSSNDNFSTSSQTVTQYGNMLANLKLNSRFTETLYGDLELAHSRYDYRLTDFANEKPPEAYYLDNQLLYRSASYHFKWHPGARHNVNFGGKAVFNQISPGEISPVEEVTLIKNQKLDEEKTFEWSVYISDEFEVLPNFSIVGGLRYTRFSNNGEKRVYIYQPGEPVVGSNVIDSLQFGAHQASAVYAGFEPRFSMNYDIDDFTSLKINYQRTRQSVFQLSNNAVVSPAETWKVADYHLKPLISDQIAVGISNKSWFENVVFETEVYYKKLQNLIEYKNGAQLLMNEHIETALIPTKGYSYGIELSAKKSTGRLTGYTSYVFSRTMRKNTSGFEDEIFWSGKYYPSIYDKPHDFSCTATYNISRRWKFSANFVFISGRPVTLPEIKYKYAGELLVYYSDRNKYRMPPYNRLDLSITFDENLRKKRMWKGSWTFAIYNVYGRNNPYSVYYKKSSPATNNDFRRYSLYKLSIIGIPVPSLTYNFKF